MKTVKGFLLVLGLLFFAGLVKAQEMERWLRIRPGEGSQIVREPIAGDLPKGTVVPLAFEGFPGALDKICREYATDLAPKPESSTPTFSPSANEISQLHEKLLLAAIEASAAAEIPVASGAGSGTATPPGPPVATASDGFPKKETIPWSKPEDGSGSFSF